MDVPYLSFFSLSEEPFSTVPSPRYFFLTPTHATALEKTSYVVGAGKGMAAVFGDTGLGKSTLARLLHQKFLDNGFVSVLLTNPKFNTPNSFIRKLADEYEIEQTNKSFTKMLDIFRDFLIRKVQDEHKTVVLIIDEANELTPTLLALIRDMLNFETNVTKLLQVVLFAQDDLRNTLARPKLRNFRSRIVMASTLDRLTLSEMDAMIRFRWEVASGGQMHPFAPDAIEAIYNHSNGMPREANIIADNALLLAYMNQLRTVSGELVNAVAENRHDVLPERKVA